MIVIVKSFDVIWVKLASIQTILTVKVPAQFEKSTLKIPAVAESTLVL